MAWPSLLPIRNRARGLAAERRACRYLQRRGWRLCARNWAADGGELDLVMSRWRTLLVVEVRSRQHDRPLASIDDAKLARTRLAAQRLIALHGLERYRLRIDAIGFDHRQRLQHRRDIG